MPSIWKVTSLPVGTPDTLPETVMICELVSSRLMMPSCAMASKVKVACPTVVCTA
nr:hypothetical protein [Simonsiella muelleri]